MLSSASVEEQSTTPFPSPPLTQAQSDSGNILKTGPRKHKHVLQGTAANSVEKAN